MMSLNKSFFQISGELLAWSSLCLCFSHSQPRGKMFIKFDTDIVDTGVDVVGFGVARRRGSGTLASVSSIFWSWRPYQRRGDTLFPPASINSEIGSVGLCRYDQRLTIGRRWFINRQRDAQKQKIELPRNATDQMFARMGVLRRAYRDRGRDCGAFFESNNFYGAFFPSRAAMGPVMSDRRRDAPAFSGRWQKRILIRAADEIKIICK